MSPLVVLKHGGERSDHLKRVAGVILLYMCNCKGCCVDMELSKANIEYTLAALRASEKAVKPERPGRIRSPKKSPKKRKRKVQAPAGEEIEHDMHPEENT